MPRRWPFLLVYAGSGAAGLVYEVAWTRLLGLEIGHGGAAAATVLGAYMGGMAAGALLAGRIARTWTPRRALRVYAGVEAVVALFAVIVPAGLAALRPGLAVLYGDDGGGLPFAAARVAACLVLLGIPTAAMGSTFPLATRGFIRSAERAGSDAGALYAANTVGAALGALGAGFLLLPSFGFRATSAIAVLLNLAAASGAWWLSTRLALADAAAERPAPVGAGRPAAGKAAMNAAAGTASKQAPSARRSTPLTRAPRMTSAPASVVTPKPHAAALVLAISGMAALAAELAWMRVLALTTGPTTYAFSAMLATFIGGLALGASAAAAFSRRIRQPGLWLAAALAAAGVSIVGVAPLVNRLPLDVIEAARAAGSGGTFIARPLLAAIAWMLPMSFGFGAAFPLGLVLATGSSEGAPRTAAYIYAANTVGAVAGSLGTGFLLLSTIGLERTFDVIAGLASVGAAIAAVTVTGRRGRLAAAAVAVVPLAVVWARPAWDLDLILGGAYKYGRYLAGVDPESALRAGTLLYHADGRTGVVSVRRTAGVLALAIDGKVDASNGGDMLTQKLLGHLPLLLHPAPRRAAVIGLGSGVTLGAVLRHPVDRVDALELSPEVVRASEYFRAESGDPLRDSRVRLVVGDGRTHLLLSRQTYDVIISEPSNPWMAGMSALFTREFFLAARDRLEAGGLMCQWAHTYDMADTDLRSIVATFASVFPGATLWLVGEGDVLLIGGRAPVVVRAADVTARWEERAIGPDLEAVRVSRPFAVLSLLAAKGDEIAGYAAGARLQTDDRLALEYSAPGAIYRASRADIGGALDELVRHSTPARAIGASASEAPAADWVDRGRMMLGAEAPRLAHASFRRALALAPRDPAGIDGLVRAAPAAGEVVSALAWLRGEVARDPENRPARIGLSRLLAAAGDGDQALHEARQAVECFPGDPGVLEQWASLLADTQQADELARVAQRLETLDPGRGAAAYYAGTASFLSGRFDEAVGHARRAVTADPASHQAWSLAAASLASAGRIEEARQAFGDAVRADPREPSVYANLGLMALNANRPDEAVSHFAEALAADAAYVPAREGLALALERLGAHDRARRLRATPRAGS